MTNFNIEEKDLVCLISCVSLHFQKWTGNPSKWVKLKTNTHGANEWNGETVFFQPGKKWLSQNLLCGHKSELIFAALYIFQTKIIE